MRHKMNLLILLLVAMLALFGCGKDAKETSTGEEGTQEAAQTAAGSGKVSLTVRAEENNFENLQKMVDSFVEKYKSEADIEVSFVAGPDSSTKNDILEDVLNTADVFFFADDQLASFVAAGGVAEVPNAAEIVKANVEEAVAACKVGDALYAYPMTADNGFFLYYDKRYLSESDVATMDSLLAAAEKAGKEVCMELSSGWFTYAFFGNTGLEFGINEDGKTNYCNWNATDTPITGEDILQGILDITASPSFVSCSNGDFVEKAKAGTAIAGVGGVWNAVDIKNAWGADYGAVKLPTYTCAGQQVQMASFKGYKMAGVNYYSKNKDWAHKLADWFTNEENQTLRFVDLNQGPSNINAAASDDVKKVPAIIAVMDQAQYGVLQRVGNNYWAPFGSFADIMAAGNPDHLKLQDIIDSLVEKITS